MKAAVATGETDQLSTVVDNYPIPEINDDQILLKAHSFAINPIDYKHIEFGIAQKGDILGDDVSGIVEKVGSNVKGFKKGDFISSFVSGDVAKTNGAFAEYVAVEPQATVKYEQLIDEVDIKSGLIKTFDGAASVTLGLVTVGISFAYSLEIPENKQDGDFILIWGGSTATGILAIQLAKLIYGLNVITTASPKNFDYLKSLGADYVFNYNDSDIVSKIKDLTKGKLRFSLDVVGTADTLQKIYDATADVKGDVYIDNVLLAQQDDINLDNNRNNSNLHWGTTLSFLVIDEVKNLGAAIPRPEDLFKYYNPWWFDVLPKYIAQLKNGNLKILKDGLASADEGLKLIHKGVSNEKIVFNV
ncbi:hypothetical protein KGF54_004230 [Candida jiufengensis]|uniref:uncharacterized protein n=1 Tax=Candida jiufengensis TaxID=497108 RepID=UPI0022250677|nr:uncharacterized protein KGF54_004230 [Candida jiufengensis]KAI5951156.1 hypothetical protein KGF54_004230 [Candida jiufengensis]